MFTNLRRTSKKTTRLHHKDQLVNAVYGNNRSLSRELFETHK
jgi:hypothetical protein